LDSATEPNYRFIYDIRYKIWRVAQINEQYRYGVFFNGLPYASNTSGQTYQVNAAATTGAWMITTKDFDKSEAEKAYMELYNQCYFPSGSTFKLEASVDQGTTWFDITDTITSSTSAINNPNIIALDLVPLGYWVRFRFSGTGPFKLYGSQRYFQVQPVQI
jgi:outer membrane protein assembly factor BamB